MRPKSPITMHYSIDYSQEMPPEAQERIHDGMTQADQNADPKWRHIFDACVLAAALKKSEITSDDVLAEIETLPNAPTTHSLAAIGPAMKRAAKMGVISPTNRFCRSRIKHKNGNAHVILRSNHFMQQKPS
jgi:hypothetical protein